MNRVPLVIVSVVITTVVWYIMHATSNNRISNEEFLQGIGGILVVHFFILLFVSNRKNQPQGKSESPRITFHSTPDQGPKHHISDIIIPKFCPNCGNANAKRLRSCEWCGKQII